MAGLTARLDPWRIGLALAAPLAALVFSVALMSVVLLIAGHSPALAFGQMADFGTQPGSVVQILDKSAGYYLSALAVAIGFRMNLFNIGVDGQYRMAAMCAAVVGAAVTLPPVLHVGLIILVAVVVGALWAGIAGVLKVTRGVSEVISTIMLNFVGGSIVAWMLTPEVFAVLQGNNVTTRPIPASGQVPGIPFLGGTVYGFIVIAALVGVGYWFLLGYTRFGFDLRATGLSEPAAVASGVAVRRMVLSSMLLSGGVAGLVGLPQLLGASYAYSLDFPAGIGFTGIAIALLGRNHPIGVALASVLWGFLDVSNQILDLNDIPKEIVTIMQGTIVLAVVIAYEVVRRVAVAQERRRVAARLGDDGPAGSGGPGPVESAAVA
ncbi:MAG TPA: ABC transporter permease [Kineosporiaceae bacterium]